MSRTGVIVLMWSMCLLRSAGAAEEDRVGASGEFRSGDIRFGVVDAYAFRTTESMGSEQVITVAVSNAGILEGNVDRWLDRRQVLEMRFKDENTAVIYFEFSLDGEYRGMNYYLGPENGCGYCRGAAESGVRLDGGRLVGPFSQEGDDVSWDIQFDVPVSGDEFGSALPPGGGEPGEVYLAFAAAARARDAEGLKQTLVAQRVEHLVGAEESGSVGDYLDFVAQGRYLDSVSVVQGFQKPTHAILAVAGEGPVGRRAGQVLLLKEPGGWRVQDEILDMASE